MNIRIGVWTVLALGLAASGLQAQVRVELKLDQHEFLKDESLPVTVRILNLSGQTLHLGADPNWLEFQITARDGQLVQERAPVPVRGEFSLESSHVASRKVDLMPWFQLEELGRYSVRAVVRIAAWNREFASPPVRFLISRGFRLWEQEFGVPGSGSPPEVRKYVLLQANYDKRLMLYVRVSDMSGLRAYRVFPAGRLLSFSHPEAQIDAQSRLHLLFQFGARAFRYLVVNPDGQIVVRQTHLIFNGSRPRLQASAQGDIYVRGGFRQISRDDLPVATLPPESRRAFSTNATNALRPAAGPVAPAPAPVAKPGSPSSSRPE